MALIQKERLYYMAPAANIVMRVELQKDVGADALADAITRASRRHATLSSRAVTDASGQATLVPHTPAPASVSPLGGADELSRALIEEAQAPLEPESGLWMRHRYGVIDGAPIWLMSMHHVAGDGISLLYFIRDTLAALDDPGLSWQTEDFRLCDPHALGGRPPLPLRLLVGSIARAWDKERRVFTPDDRRRVTEEYWSGRKLCMLSRALDGDALNKALEACRSHGVTLTAAVCAAMLIADGEAKNVALAASIRPSGYEGMANWATGITVSGSPATPFWELASSLKRGMDDKLNNDAKRNYLLKFLDLVPPTLMDASYFSAFDRLESKPAASMSRLLGFSGEPKGISMTNLLRAPVGDGVMSIRFYPPLVPNVRRLIGMATVGDRLEITLQASDTPEECERYIDRLMSVISEAL